MLSQLQRYMHIKFTRCLSYRGNYDDKSKEQIPDIEAYLVPLTEGVAGGPPRRGGRSRLFYLVTDEAISQVAEKGRAARGRPSYALFFKRHWTENTRDPAANNVQWFIVLINYHSMEIIKDPDTSPSNYINAHLPGRLPSRERRALLLGRSGRLLDNLLTNKLCYTTPTLLAGSDSAAAARRVVNLAAATAPALRHTRHNARDDDFRPRGAKGKILRQSRADRRTQRTIIDSCHHTTGDTVVGSARGGARTAAAPGAGGGARQCLCDKSF
ncbi:hypothetical protein EVAR_20981_1 [Eumeta japonica]|uniref:Uncharacterized protein n=1 Tax=Eumeta variegata TaxID=151549 RepID=A0A4C1V5S5_EUMVA|nr:hypothetical protein EVAR_20981_1 [Eumeta japonica]